MLEQQAVLGFTLREAMGYGGIIVGGVTAVSGLAIVLTRDDFESDYNATTNVLTVRRRQSRAPGYTTLGTGLAIAAAGAFLLMVEPSIGLIASVGPEGSAYVGVHASY